MNGVAERTFAARDVPGDQLDQQAPHVKARGAGAAARWRAPVRRVPPGAHESDSEDVTVDFDDLEVGIDELQRCEHRRGIPSR